MKKVRPDDWCKHFQTQHLAQQLCCDFSFDLERSENSNKSKQIVFNILSTTSQINSSQAYPRMHDFLRGHSLQRPLNKTDLERNPGNFSLNQKENSAKY